MRFQNTAFRYSQASFFSVIVTLAIFFLMQMLVSENQTLKLDYTDYKTIEIFEAEPPDFNPPPPPDVFDPVDPPIIDPLPPIVGNPPIGVIVDPIPVDPLPQNIGTLGNNYPVAIIKMVPPYPTQALRAEKEGYVVLEFTVNEKGLVENIVILDESPKGFGFGKAAAQAAAKFRFNPKVVNGNPVLTNGVREKFEFRLKDRN